ncbi:copper resistance protein CopC [Rhodococcus sp. NPDC058521]|uniref:copper resistance CopC family protein n=1 Tax=Rhodococcus sp. NPDC058521 TaxID=3346536 RepID=UPI003657D757
MSAPIRTVAVGLLALVALFLTAGPAAAHSVVTGSDPEDGAQISSGPAEVTVTFNEALQEGFASLTVVGPDGNLWSRSDAKVDGPTVSTEVGDLGPVGDYTIAFRVTSADGHPVSGTRTFTLTEEGSGTPGPAADSSGSGDSGSGGVPIWVFVVAGVVVFAGALAFALRKPREDN